MEPNLFTIERFYRSIGHGKLVGGKCRKCGKIHLPPRPLCGNCLSADFEWVELPQKGKLVTYTVIHVAPPQFQCIAPYAVGIIQLENGVNLPGIIRDTPLNRIEIGMSLKIEFEEAQRNQQWPQWPRYYFKPA